MAQVKVLIVEDEGTIAERIRRILDKKGYIVTAIVDSGIGAIQAMEKDSADLVLMDINLKGKVEGIITAKAIKNKYPVSVIYITELADEEIFQKAKETFPKNYISKPFSDETIIHAVEIAIQQPENLLKPLDSIETNVSDGIFVLTNNEKGYQKILFNEILYIEANGPGSYTNIFVETKEKTNIHRLTVSLSSNHVIEQLTYPGIAKVNRSCYVNIHKIERIMGTQIFIHTHAITVSKEYKNNLDEKLMYLRHKIAKK